MNKSIKAAKQDRTIEIAKKMKIEGLDNNLIIKLTGLTLEEIEKL